MTQSPALDSLVTRLRSTDGALPAYLDWLAARFETIEPGLHAFLPEADRFERLRKESHALLEQFPDPASRPALFGLPLGVKDIFHVNGFETHAGSQLPVEVLAGDQAECVTALRQAGGLILGKTVTTEFAYFAPGPTRNPHNPQHTPGGSSSGSAAAVAAGLAPFALGTQTIGSINRPASFCGVVGYKPSFARISTRGVIPLSPSLDHIGYFTPNAASAAWIAPFIVEGWKQAETTPETLRLAIPVGPYLEKADSTALEQFNTVCELLRAAGHAVLEQAVMADFEEIVERHNLILAVDAMRVHRTWFEEFHNLYHAKTIALIQRGKTIPQDDYQVAMQEKAGLRIELERVMDENAIDAWITPSAPGAAPAGLESTGDPVMNLPWTQSGMPTLTLPSGKSAAGLPLGLQVIARVGQDEQLLAWAGQLEPLFEYEGIGQFNDFLEAYD